MKIKIVNYKDGEALVVFEEMPTTTFCVKLAGKTTKEEVINELKSRLPEADETETLFNALDLKSLEGTDI